jgi:predicted ATPase
VIGREVPLTLLQAVTRLSDEALSDHLRPLQAAEFLYETRLVPEVVYTFKHALTQEVAYQSFLRRTRQQLHARIAEVLATHFPETARMQPALLAYHYTEAGQHAEAIGYWERAGQQAFERSAYAEATSHLTKGIELLAALTRRRGRALNWACRPRLAPP